ASRRFIFFPFPNAPVFSLSARLLLYQSISRIFSGCRAQWGYRKIRDDSCIRQRGREKRYSNQICKESMAVWAPIHRVFRTFGIPATDDPSSSSVVVAYFRDQATILRSSTAQRG